VLSWVAAQPRSLLYTTYVGQAEISYGIAALPAGRRRTALVAAAEAMFADDFAGRLWPFEERAATRYPEIVLARRHAGHPIEKFDALIAGDRSRNQPGDPVDVLVAVGRHAEPHHHHPR